MLYFQSKALMIIRVLQLSFLTLLFLWSSYSCAQTQTSFEKMGANTPNYKIIQRVINSKKLKLKSLYGNRWGSGKYGGAWERVKQYFPKKFYMNSSKVNFMHHWFNPKGQLEMAIYKSKELDMAVTNYFTYNDRTIVTAYNKIREQKNKDAAIEFKKKLGLLEKYFLSEKERKLLKKYLKDEKSMTRGVKGIYHEMLKELREEGDHMFAAALLHEGMHAKMDNDQKVAQIDRDFKSCKTPVQWDEFRGYISEIEYHMNYYTWSMQNINAHWQRIESLLKDLEKFREFKKPLSKANLTRIEKIKAKIKAHIAIIRVRIREIQQSLDRMKGLIAHFKKNYFKKDNEKKYKNFKEIKEMIDGVDKKVNDFAAGAQKAIDDKEKALRDLEDILKNWNIWAACKIPQPPNKEKHKKVVTKFKGTPIPPTPSTETEKDEAEKNIVKSSGTARSSIESPMVPKPKSTNDSLLNKKEIKKVRDTISNKNLSNTIISVSVGIDIANFKLDDLNNYFNYLNNTWNGNISPIENEIGYWVNTSISITDKIDLGIEYTHFTNSTTGFLASTSSDYRSENTLNILELVINYGIDIGATGLTLNIKCGIGSYWSNYTETENGFTVEGKSSAFGYKFSGGIGYTFTNWLDVYVNFGYRNAVIEDYNNDVEFFQPQDSEVKLDFSGSYSQMGVRIKF